MIIHTAHDEIEVCRDVPIRDDEVTKALQQAILSKESFCWVVEIQGKIEGALIGFANRIWYSKKKELVDFFAYTTEKARGYGTSLYRKYIIWGRRHPGVVRIYLSNTSGVDTISTEKLFSLLGGERIGANYIIRSDSNE